MTVFQVGDRVQSQGRVPYLDDGIVYVVAEIQERCTPFGNFVTYWVRKDQPGATTLTAVCNAHLLLRRAS